MAKGYDFEEDVRNYLATGYEIIPNYQASAAEQGKRREIDIVAITNSPPFGDIYFLVECKTTKIGAPQVEEFKNKLIDIKQGGDKYADGIPVMISPEGFSSGAKDAAKTGGIRLMTFEELQSADIPIPRNIDIHINIVHHLNGGIISREETIDIPEWGKISIVKSVIDYNIKGLGLFNIYMELLKGAIKKEMILAFGKYIGKVNEEVMRLWIQKIDGYIENQRKKGSKVSAAIGFYTRSVSDDDKKLITKVKNSTQSSVAVIDENSKVYGNVDAKVIFAG